MSAFVSTLKYLFYVLYIKNFYDFLMLMSQLSPLFVLITAQKKSPELEFLTGTNKPVI